MRKRKRDGLNPERDRVSILILRMIVIVIVIMSEYSFRLAVRLSHSRRSPQAQSVRFVRFFGVS
jgi:hypothetical protein